MHKEKLEKLEKSDILKQGVLDRGVAAKMNDAS